MKQIKVFIECGAPYINDQIDKWINEIRNIQQFDLDIISVSASECHSTHGSHYKTCYIVYEITNKNVTL